jgi:ubiquinone/menaquinone biosynthesis C-methylase UbiE
MEENQKQYDVLDYFFSMVKEKPKVVDIGCGTGIITRQLHERGAHVVGVDRDSQMLVMAESHKIKGIEYKKALANNLPFENASFDAATAFSSFHWFDNTESLKEISRVLKPGGVFFIANRSPAPEFSSGFKDVLKPFIDGEFPRPKDRAFSNLLTSTGFINIMEKAFVVKERYTAEDIRQREWLSTFNRQAHGI